MVRASGFWPFTSTERSLATSAAASSGASNARRASTYCELSVRSLPAEMPARSKRGEPSSTTAAGVQPESTMALTKNAAPAANKAKHTAARTAFPQFFPMRLTPLP